MKGTSHPTPRPAPRQPKPTRIILELRATWPGGPDVIVGLRWLLKRLWRSCGIKCTSVEPAPPAERDENTCREPLTPSEAVAMAEHVAKAEAKMAKERQDASHSKAGKASGETRRNDRKSFPSVRAKQDDSKRTRSIAAASVGMSRPTLEKAEAVVKSGDKEIITLMDRSGKVER